MHKINQSFVVAMLECRRLWFTNLLFRGVEAHSSHDEGYLCDGDNGGHPPRIHGVHTLAANTHHRSATNIPPMKLIKNN